MFGIWLQCQPLRSQWERPSRRYQQWMWPARSKASTLFPSSRWFKRTDPMAAGTVDSEFSFFFPTATYSAQTCTAINRNLWFCMYIYGVCVYVCVCVACVYVRVLCESVGVRECLLYREDIRKEVKVEREKGKESWGYRRCRERDGERDLRERERERSKGK